MQINMRIFTEEVTKAFQKLSVNVSGTTAQVKAAVISGAMLLRNAAAQKAPFITGTLKRSIHIGGHTKEPGSTEPFTPGQDKAQHGAEYSDIGGEFISSSVVQVEVGTNLVYAPRIEYGFSGKDKLGRTYNQPPHPYLRTAFDQEKDNVAREIDRVLDQLIRQAGF